MWYYNADHPLRRYFSGLAEHAFVDSLGMADPHLIDYLSLLLARFVHMNDHIRLRTPDADRTLEQVADMLLEAAALPAGRTCREVHRHIGDFTLFWTGVYPEALKQQYRETLAFMGGQRIVSLGGHLTLSWSLPHDAIEPIRRLCRWINDENVGVESYRGRSLFAAEDHLAEAVR